MKKNSLYVITIILAALLPLNVFGQIVGTHLFLQGKYLEIGAQNNASLGGVSAPSSYHPHSSGASVCGSSSRTLAHVFDYGYDGWTTGSPAYMGDYTLPGSPWEGWGIEVAGATGYANSTACSFTGTLTGSWTSYTNVGGRAIGTWTGSFGTGGALAIRQEYRVDTLASALIFTVVLKNTTAAPLNGVYYMRSCDPDNPQSWGGSFATTNQIVYQNDFYHRVMVTATSQGASSATGIPPQPLSLCTKDCRAKAIIFTSWPLSTSCLISNIWAGTYGCVSTAATTAEQYLNGDIAIGLLYNCCSIPAYDSTTISYAYVYNGTGGIDNAFPNPKLNVNGTEYDSVAVVTACTGAFGDTLPVNIMYGDDKNWKWSEWSWAPATGLLSTTGTISGVVVSSLTGVTTYTITGNDSARGGCTCNSKVFYLTVVPAVFGPPTVADVYYCQGDYASVLTASGVNLLWYTSATGGTGSTTAPTPSTSTPGTYTYYVSQTPCPGSESARVPIRVFVTPQPIVIAANNGPLCAGDTLRLFGIDTFTTGTISFIWTGPGTFISTLQNPVIAPSSPSDSGVYTVTMTVNGCVSAPASTLAVVHYTPPAPSVTPVTYCQYDASAPVVASGTNLLYYYPSITSTASAAPPSPSTASAGTFHCYVTQTTNGCESPAADLVITINPKPSVPVASSPVYCQYDLPSALSASGSSMLWYGPGVYASTTPPTPSTTTPGIDTYYVTQTLLGCVSDRAMVTVRTIAKPSAPVTADTSYCQFFNAPALTASGSNLKWYTVPTGGTALTSTPVPNTNTVGSTTWYVSQTVNGCESDRAPLTVTVLYLPSFTLSQSRTYVCQYDTLTFNYAGPGLTGAIYQWFIPNGASYQFGTDSNDALVYVKFDSLYFQKVILSASSYYGRCTTFDTVDIKVVYEPTASAYIRENICQGDTVTIALSNRSGNAADFVWDLAGGSVITGSSHTGGPYKVSFNDTGIQIIKLQPFTTEGCKGKITYDTIRVHPAPDATIVTDGKVKVICLEDSVYLSCRDDNHGHKYTWAPNHFFRNNNNSSIWGKIEVAGYVTLTVTDAFGCSATDSVLFNPQSCCTVAFPLAFTPNGDGKNDVFRPLFDGYHRFHDFRIVNRWGQTVFESTNSKMEWDGTFGGVPQDMGVYYFFIKYDCDDDGRGKKERVEKGEVTLIR